jgi:hypothetical protein
VVVGFGFGEGIGIGRGCKDDAARGVVMAGQLGLLCAKKGCGNHHKVSGKELWPLALDVILTLM